jgi:2-iminobutanoate/2-iminopropanoate deaminase
MRRALLRYRAIYINDDQRGGDMDASETRTHFPPPGGYDKLPFSSGVLAGNTFYLSGHLGVDLTTRKIPASVETEVRLMLDGFRATLEKADLTMQDLVYVQIFCSDVSLFEQFNAIYRTYFSEPLPARAFIGSGPLLFGAHFEIQGIATAP